MIYNPQSNPVKLRRLLTASSLPQTQAASSGAPGSLGSSLREGNRVQLGSQGRLSGAWTDISGEAEVDDGEKTGGEEVKASASLPSRSVTRAIFEVDRQAASFI